MALSSSLFTGTSGLINMGNVMQVISNNISNSNTVGFKKGVSSFGDVLSQSVATQGGIGQIGRGMAIGEVAQNFTQGSFETTGNATDMSIGGDGFFIVSSDDSEMEFYTRAGNFHFDEAGKLVNPEGYILQGWELDSETGDNMGAIGDIIMDTFTSPPKASSEMTAITNLDADAESKSDVLSNFWDSDEETPLGSNIYEYQTVIQVYDSLGSPHDMTVYYDKKSAKEWEYLITCNPDDDMRELVQGTTAKGLLARGTITFNESSGSIIDMTMSEFTGRIGSLAVNGINDEEDVHFAVENQDAMALDGYGFEVKFDGNEWALSSFTNAETAINYKDASIAFSNSQSIELILNTDDKLTDLQIILDKEPTVGDTVSFDINAADGIHVQAVEGSQFVGDTDDGNTTIQINDPGVMNLDNEDIRMIWYPAEDGGKGKWRWSNPTVAAKLTDTDTTDDYEQTLVKVSQDPNKSFDIGADDLGAFDYSNDGNNWNEPGEITFNNDAVPMTMYCENIQLKYDAGTPEWQWNMPLKEEDFGAKDPKAGGAMTFEETPTLTIVDSSPNADLPTNLAAYDAAGTYQLSLAYAAGPPETYTWTLDSYTNTVTEAAATGSAAIDATATNDNTQVNIILNDGSKIRYSFPTSLTSNDDTGTLTFTIDPTPPEEYPNAEVVAGTVVGDIAIKFNTTEYNYTDPDLEIATGALAPATTEFFTFSVDPDVAPEKYANAKLTGDDEQAVIDLDGSGNEDDDDDIVFSFKEPLSTGQYLTAYEDRSEISFEISGSTAWKDIAKDDIKSTGYFGFTADFLGGDAGSTETKIEFNIGSKYDGENFLNNSLTTTQYAKASSTVYQDADGYSAGDLEGVDVSSDGSITGIYSNGELIPLFRVGLAKFLNNNGLFNAGGNLFRETRDSGGAITNSPGENGLGTIASNSLEMSNVDISEEFVKMITTQRGFQANSKTVTTVDDMMNTVIQMKR